MRNLTTELREFRTQFEDAVTAHEREVKSLHEQNKEVGRQRESVLREVRTGGEKLLI